MKPSNNNKAPATVKVYFEGHELLTQCRGENMWVKDVQMVGIGHWKGIVDNVPVLTPIHGYELRDVVHFHDKGSHQYDAYPKGVESYDIHVPSGS